MGYFYGPVLSRRLGFSLGVDLVPKKTCSFNCIYCQLGQTTRKSIRRFSYIDLNKLKKELKEIIKQNPKIDYITISGSGEPTLHKNLDKIIGLIKKVTKNKFPVCVITNSSLLYKKAVRRELKKADLLIPSLDAVTPQIFHKINRPSKEITIEKIIKGLIELRREFKGKIWLEIMLVAHLNDTLNEAKKIKAITEKINPDKIQLNLPVRPGGIILSLPPPKRLKAIKKIIGKNVNIISSFHKRRQKRFSQDINKDILEFLKRRPQSLDDLTDSLAINPNQVIKSLNILLDDGKIRKYCYRKKNYFVYNK